MKKYLFKGFIVSSLILLLSGCGANNEALHIPAGKGDLASIQQELAKGADVNAKDAAEQTPLMYASESGRLDIVKYLVENGADVNAKSFNKRARGTALIYASSNNRVDVMNYLLDHGANINETTDPMEESSLFWTVAKGYVEGTELLLKRGIMVNLKNKKGETALDIGRKLNRTQLVNLIEQYKK